MLFLLLLLFVFPLDVCGHKAFQTKIPNGVKVHDPCDGKTIWGGVGHKAAGGTGPRNPFGKDFRVNNMVWNRTICEMDSDRDGVSNGEELGDPDCVWTPGDEPATTPTGHPGICEPLDDLKCRQQNTWFSCHNKGELDCDAVNRPDVKTITMKFPETSVPDDTTNICMNFELPSDGEYHVIANEGLIDNPDLTHHVLVFACQEWVELSDLKHPLHTTFMCGMQGDDHCGNSIALSTVGVPGFCHADNTGFRIGTSGYRYVSIQLHWNNPDHDPSLTDSSGMVLYYTPVLRPYNLGIVWTGDTSFMIPPGEPAYVVESQCTSTCPESKMNTSIYITQGMFHMHLIGSLISGSVLNDYYYGFPYYSYRLHSPVEVKPGDVLNTKCVFGSTDKRMTTMFGAGISEEMCYAILFFYPKEALQMNRCLTYQGISDCSMESPTHITDGCQMHSFTSDIVNLLTMRDMIKERCTAFVCRQECKEYIKEIRQNPCLQGRVADYMFFKLRDFVDNETLTLYRSCDVDIALEANTCQCPVQT